MTRNGVFKSLWRIGGGFTRSVSWEMRQAILRDARAKVRLVATEILLDALGHGNLGMTPEKRHSGDSNGCGVPGLQSAGEQSNLRHVRAMGDEHLYRLFPPQGHARKAPPWKVPPPYLEWARR